MKLMILIPRGETAATGGTNYFMVKNIWYNPPFYLHATSQKTITTYHCYGTDKKSQMFTYAGTAPMPVFIPFDDKSIEVSVVNLYPGITT